MERDWEYEFREMNALQTKEGKLELLSREDYEGVSDIIDDWLNEGDQDEGVE